MKSLFVIAICFATSAYAHNSYTGNYSGAPGKSACASSCHGNTNGTVVVTGFPSTYRPGQAYRIVVKRSSGSLIVNYNATTRVGATSTVAGTFSSLTNSTLYSGADGGVYASPHSIDSSVFQWTAPAAGTGAVNFYCAAYQGTTSSANGSSTRISFSSTENTTSVEDNSMAPKEFSLAQNYPNPFNPATNLEFRISETGFVSLKVFELSGREVQALVNNVMTAGEYKMTFDGSGLSSGIYLYRLSTKGVSRTRKMVITK
jgi:hypothetical protein